MAPVEALLPLRFLPQPTPRLLLRHPSLSVNWQARMMSSTAAAVPLLSRESTSMATQQASPTPCSAPQQADSASCCEVLVMPGGQMAASRRMPSVRE